MKEKIWIEKLIELLNEYSKNIWYFNEEDLRWQTKAWILSKEFWFIKWLVENDKINKDLISRVLIRAYISPKTLVSLECEFHDYYESLLMLLSISDTPIEDLVSYLK